MSIRQNYIHIQVQAFSLPTVTAFGLFVTSSFAFDLLVTSHLASGTVTQPPTPSPLSFFRHFEFGLFDGLSQRHGFCTLQWKDDNDRSERISKDEVVACCKAIWQHAWKIELNVIIASLYAETAKSGFAIMRQEYQPLD
jgi:hypothetical protein